MKLFLRLSLLVSLFTILSFSAFAFSTTSTAFANNTHFNYSYTCVGVDIAPSFNLTSLPNTTVAVAVLMNDSTADFSHWAMYWNTTYNMTDESYFLAENVTPENSTSYTNDFSDVGYDGPCAPGAGALPLIHSYDFIFYALNSTDLVTDGNADNLHNAVQNITVNTTRVTVLGRPTYLFGPDNDTTVGDNANITYGVAQASPECTLYTNVTGTWASLTNASATGANPGTDTTTTNNFTVDTSSLIAGDYIYNVVCNTTTLDKGFAQHNRTFTIAAIQNVSVTKTVTPQNNGLYGNFTYTLNITNLGNFDLFDVNITDYWNSTAQNITLGDGGDGSVSNHSWTDTVNYSSRITWLANISQGNSIIIFFNLTGIRTSINALNSVNVSNVTGALLAQTSVLVNITDVIPPGAITNLDVESETNSSIEFTWTNPTDGDFNATILYLNGSNIANVTNTSTNYNVSGLLANAQYNFTVFTKDQEGNINDSNVTRLASTLANPFVGIYSIGINKTVVSASADNGTNASFIITILNTGTLNITNHTVRDSFNSSHLNFTTSNVSTSSTADGVLEWTLNLTTGSSWSVAVNFTGIVLGNTTNYAVFENATDEQLGNDSGILNITLAADTTPPGSISSLTNASLDNQSIYFTWTNPTDLDFNASILYLDGSNIANVTNGSSAYNVTGLTANTLYNMTVNTKDQSGNINDSHVTLLVRTAAIPDIIAPGFALNAPGAGTTANQSTALVNVTFVDGNSGLDVSTISITINGTNYAFGSLSCSSSTDGVTSNTCYVTSQSLPDGNIVVNASASDVSGNTNSSSFTFIKNDTLPTITVSNPTSGSTIYASSLNTIVNVSFDEEVTSAVVSFNSSASTLCSTCNSALKNISVGEYGSRNVTVNATDAAGNQSSTTFLITYVKDLNGNNIDDDVELQNASGDTDGDGVNNSEDSVHGNASNIASNIPDINVTIGGDDNLSQGFSGSQTVSIGGNGTTLVTFSFNFNAGNNQTIDFTQVGVQTQDDNATSGSIVISGIDLTSQGTTKTVVMDRLNTSSSGICIVDQAIASVNEIQGDCGNGVEIECNGVAQSGYTCTKINSDTQYQISGLVHSGITQSSYTAPVSSSSSSSSGSSGGGSRSAPEENSTGTGTAWSNLAAGVLVEYDISNDKIPVEQVSFTLTEDLRNPSLDVASYEHRPFDLDEDAPGALYRYLDISGTLISNALDSATVTFRVPQTWVTGEGVDRDAVALYRYDGSDWEMLSTTYVRTSGSDYIYEADSPGFSYFAIAADGTSGTVSQEDADTDETVGDEGVAVEDSPESETGEEESEGSNVGWIIFWIVILAVGVGVGVWYTTQHPPKKKK